MALVEIRPLDIPKWHGKRGKESFAQPVVIEALYDHKIGGYATGLTEEEALKYGKKLGVDLSNVFNQDEAHPFWGSKMGRIKLDNVTTILDDTKSLEFVKVKVLKASKYVANSLKEWESGDFPEATHVIFDEGEEVAVKARKAQKRKKAVQLSIELSLKEQANVVQILTGKPMSKVDQEFIDVEVADLIDNNLEEFLRVASMDKSEMFIRAVIHEAIYRNVLIKEGPSIYYMSDKIGYDFEEAVKWLSNPQNQNIKLSILEKLNN